MKGKLLGSLAALPLIAVGVVGGMDSASAASLIEVGDTLNISGSVIADPSNLDFLVFGSTTASPGTAGEFKVETSTGFFAANNPTGSAASPTYQVGAIQDLIGLSSGGSIGPIANFLDCSGCDNPFTFDLSSATRTDLGTAANIFLSGVFNAGGTIIGSGTLTSQINFDSGTGSFKVSSYSASATAVPEPTTTAGLLAAGALGAFKAGRRNKKKQEEEVTA